MFTANVVQQKELYAFNNKKCVFVDLPREKKSICAKCEERVAKTVYNPTWTKIIPYLSKI